MRPETRFILATALFVNSCAPLIAHAEESPDDSKSHVVVPTATLIPPTPTFYNFDIPLTSTIEPVMDQTSETLFADKCVLPFEGALME